MMDKRCPECGQYLDEDGECMMCEAEELVC